MLEPLNVKAFTEIHGLVSIVCIDEATFGPMIVILRLVVGEHHAFGEDESRERVVADLWERARDVLPIMRKVCEAEAEIIVKTTEWQVEGKSSYM